MSAPLQKYIFFCLVATLLNLGIQHIVFLNHEGPYTLYLALVLGTGIGLITKFVFDKKFVFNTKFKNLLHSSQKFTLYTLLGGFTTIIFWSVEILFYFVWPHEMSKYIGGCLGLAIGYIIKFHLDKKFVFS